MLRLKELQENMGGFVFTIPIILLLLGVGSFFVWGMASINWQGILAVFAAGIIAMAFAGFFFFGADWNYVMISCVIALAIVFIVEVSFPILVGGLVILMAMWNLKMLSKKPLMLMGLVILGLGVMLVVKLSVLGA